MSRWEAIVLGLSVAAMAGFVAGKYEGTPRTGMIVVDVEPADATVLVDNVMIGRGPRVTAERRPGPYTISVTRNGYARSDRTVDVVAGGSTALKVALEASPDTGFELTSEPPGQLVWLDDVRIRNYDGSQARTNFRVSRIKPGFHRIELRGEGLKKWIMEIGVAPGEIRKVHAVMVPGQ